MFEAYDKAKQEVSEYVLKCIAKAEEFGDAHVANALRAQLREIHNLRFNIAVVGTIKRGKSTLINTILGQANDDLSPIDSKVCTGGIVHYVDLSCLPDDDENKEPHARVFFYNREEPDIIATEDLDEYIREERNPKNKKGVSRVEVYGDFPLLHSCALVDTPGADAVIEEHGEAVYSFLPNADAVIMTVMAGMAMTNNEQKMLKVLSSQQQRKIFYVLTKVDDQLEEDIPGILGFVRDKISEAQLQVPGRIYEVACRKVFDARRSGAAQEEIDRLKQQWGVARLERDLESFIIKNSEQGKSLLPRLETTLKSAQTYIDQKIGENDAFIHTQDCDIADIQKAMDEARRAFSDFEKNMNTEMTAFSRDWNRKKEKGLVKLDSIAEKVKFEVNNIVTQPGLLKSLKNAFSLNHLVNQKIFPLYKEFAMDEEEEFEQTFNKLSEGMCEQVDIYAKNIQTPAIISTAGAAVVGGTAACAVGGGVVALGEASATIVSALMAPTVVTGGPIVTWLAGVFGADSFIVSLFGGGVVGPLATIGPALSAALPAVLVAAATAVTAGPVTRFISSLFVPGQVDKNVAKQKEAFSKQADQAREMILQNCQNAIEERRDALESSLQRLEVKLSHLSPEDKQKALAQNEQLKLLTPPQISL